MLHSLTKSASSNPRTSQRALLVAAELARLIPEAVLHNVMSIFTFMGSSDYQRDDAYSFGVVERVSYQVVLRQRADTSDCIEYRAYHDEVTQGEGNNQAGTLQWSAVPKLAFPS